MDALMTHDTPPDYREVKRHAAFPAVAHDEAARFNFLAAFNRHVAGVLGPGNAAAYRARVLPQIMAERGRPPADRHEIRRAMLADPYHRFWSALKRNSMEMRQQAGRAMVLRQREALEARVKMLNASAPDTLQLDATIGVPRYQAAVDIHCMPGSYYGETGPDCVLAGANYDCGIFATTGGALGGLTDGGGQALARWAHEHGMRPRRILELGTTIGHNIVPLARAFPDAEVWAIDTAAASLRYGHARAQALGATNIRFVQMNAEDLSRFADGHFDWVQTTMFLHELSGKALPRIIAEGARVLAPGGLMLHLEQPAYTDAMPLFEQFMRDWDAFNNNEPFWSAMHALDIPGIMDAAGLPRHAQFAIKIAAEVDRDIFPAPANGGTEDYGRAAQWDAYGARKPEAQRSVGAPAVARAEVAR